MEVEEIISMKDLKVLEGKQALESNINNKWDVYIEIVHRYDKIIIPFTINNSRWLIAVFIPGSIRKVIDMEKIQGKFSKCKGMKWAATKNGYNYGNCV